MELKFLLNEVYLDNAATTKPSKECVSKVIELLEKKYGNPSSLHKKGLEAENEVTFAKKVISKELNAELREIYFTSGGTESNNLAIFGAAQSRRKCGNKIITTQIEHSSVYETVRELEKLGYEVIYLKPDKFGLITLDQLQKNIDDHTILVSIMFVNNEIGSILPVDKIKRIIKLKKSPALLHIDAVQAFGKLPIDVELLGADLLTISAHKIHGPKGIGALYVNKKVKLVPRSFGGLQQKKLRPGTEAVPLIGGFANAVRDLNLDDNFNKVTDLNNYCRQKLNELSQIKINSSSEFTIPHILNFSTNCIKSETLLNYLSDKEIYVSSSSACAKGKKSHVLSAMGLDDKTIDTSIRVSFSKYNTARDVDRLLEALKNALVDLTKI